MNILEHQTFSGSPQPPFNPSCFRTPIYPLFLSAIYLIFGHNPPVVIFIQILLSTLIIVIIYKIGELVFNIRSGLISGFIFALTPVSIIYTNHLLTETVFTVFLIAAFYFFIRFVKKDSYINILCVFAFLGIAVLTRPLLIYFPIIILLIIIIWLWYRREFKSSILKVLVSFILYILIVGTWASRNYIFFGVTELTSVKGINMFYYNAVSLEVERSRISKQDAKKYLEDFYSEILTDDGYKLLNSMKRSDILWELGIDYIKRYPFLYVKAHSISVISALLPRLGPAYNLIKGDMRKTGVIDILLRNGFRESYKQFLKINRVLIITYIYLILFNSFLFLFSFLGLIYCFMKKLFVIGSLFFLLIFYLIVLSGGPGTDRFIFPVMPLLSILAGCSINDLWKKYKCLKKKNC